MRMTISQTMTSSPVSSRREEAEEMDLAERIERGEAIPTPHARGREDDEDEKALAALEG